MSEKSLNVWDYKPWWCQPWSIILTGIVVIMGSWLAIKNLWLTLFLSLLICLWWVYFLIIYPQMVAKMLKED